MRIRYDSSANAVAIFLSDADVVSTEEIDNGTLVDVDAFGNAIGIEVINPNRQWPLGEIIDRFGIDPETAQVLRDLLLTTYPSGVTFTPERELVA